MFAQISLFAKVAWRQWRGSRSGLALLVVCLILSSASLGLVGMLGDTVRVGIERDGRKILGGDVALTLVQRKADDQEWNYIQENNHSLSQIITLSTMAQDVAGTVEALASVKAVDGFYPMVGEVIIDQKSYKNTEFKELLSSNEGRYGVVVQQALLDRMSLNVGDQLRIGDISLVIRGILDSEPDPSFGVMVFGPKIIVSKDALHAAGLVQEGSLVRHHYRINLPKDRSLQQWRDDFDDRFGNTGWRIRDYNRPMENAEDGLNRTWMFLALSTLITVLSAGIGITNGVRRFLQSHMQSIAVLRVLGATQRQVQLIYGLLLASVTLISIAVGLSISAGLIQLILPLLKDFLPISLQPNITAWAIGYTFSNGLLVVAVFALFVLTSAAAINPSILFRHSIYSLRLVKPTLPEFILFIFLAISFIALNIFSVDRSDIAAIFIVSVFILLGLLWVLAKGLTWLSMRIKVGNFMLRYALANLSRPGAITGQVVISLGLGLSVLVLINSLESNITNRLDNVAANEAPSFYFIDIQSTQLDRFSEIVAPFQQKMGSSAMLRGRITHLAGVSVDDLPKNDEFGWITRGDRAFTWSSDWPEEKAKSAPVVEGEWWAKDYNGPMLVSFDHDAAKSFGLNIGDKVGLNILGRAFEAEVANLRKINWQNFTMNFVMVLSPGMISAAPHTHIATVTTDPNQEAALQKAVVAELPNVSALRLKDVLSKASELLGSLLLAIRSIGSVSIVVGVIVLVSALIAVQTQKAYENQILRVVGVDRRMLFKIIALELLILGLFAATIAAFAGNIIAWSIVQFGLKSEFVLDISGALGILFLGQIITLMAGLLIAWKDLRNPQARQLRNE